MLRALVVAHDLSDYRYVDDVTRNLFNMACGLKMLETLIFRIKVSESLEKFSRSYYKEEKRRNGLSWKKSSQQLSSCDISTRDSLFCEMFSPLFCLEQEKTLKSLRTNYI